MSHPSNHTTPSCDELREDYLFGMMDEAEEHAFQVHVGSCLVCQTAMQEHQHLTQIFTPPATPLQGVTAQEHEQLLGYVLQATAEATQAEPVAVERVHSTSEHRGTSGLWDWLSALLPGHNQSWLWRLTWSTVAAACIMLLLWWPGSKQNPRVAVRVSQPNRTTAMPSTTRTRTEDRLQMTYHIEMSDFSPLAVSAGKVASKSPVVNTDVTRIQLRFTYDPNAFLALSQHKERPQQSPGTTKAVTQHTEHADGTDDSDQILLAERNGALVESGKLATLASLEQRPRPPGRTTTIW